MKISAVNGVDPSPRGHAYGLVRQLQEGTFKGASIEKHSARYADRLESEAPQSTDIPAEVEETGVIVPVVDDVTAVPSAPDEGSPQETVTIFGGLGTYVDTYA